MTQKSKLPELLAPAGSPAALEAAIEAGADAVYFGGAAFSNRMRAKNFTAEELVSAVRLCSAYGVASHITVNTRLRDRELSEALSLARSLWDAGASAFIVADIGFAELLKQEIPGVVLHGSTQLTGVCSADAEAMASLGFSRMVCPRELSECELRRLVAESPIEIEMFVHGALCVSVSGQCLMSWAMGGRSGNRGECAQPCRLPYSLNGKKAEHLLSLKDSCLAGHIPEILGLGVASLKIEGRMKGADYVYGVTRIYRRLLDEGRAATRAELCELEALFSRDGFTDGYFTGKRVRMNGMRPEGVAESEGIFTGLSRKLPVSVTLEATAGECSVLTLTEGGHAVRVTGGPVQEAQRAPATEESVYKNISRLGGTPYSLDRADFRLLSEGEVFIPTSELNELRRRAVDALISVKTDALREGKADFAAERGCVPEVMRPVRLGEFARADGAPDSAWEYFDAIFMPYGEVEKAKGKAELALPPWTADSAEIASLTAAHKARGGRYVLCHTLGQISIAREAGLTPVASFRLNTANEKTAEVLRGMGSHYTVLSPELPLAAMRDICKAVPGCGAVVYGHLPLMLLRKCILKSQGCSGNCGGVGCAEGSVLTDRRGGETAVLSAGDGTNVLLNSHVIWSADREREKSCLDVQFCIFTSETEAEADSVISAYKNGLSPEEAGVRKIKRM